MGRLARARVGLSAWNDDGGLHFLTAVQASAAGQLARLLLGSHQPVDGSGVIKFQGQGFGLRSDRAQRVPLQVQRLAQQFPAIGVARLQCHPPQQVLGGHGSLRRQASGDAALRQQESAGTVFPLRAQQGNGLLRCPGLQGHLGAQQGHLLAGLRVCLCQPAQLVQARAHRAVVTQAQVGHDARIQRGCALPW